MASAWASVRGAILISQERTTLGADVHRYGPRTGPLYAFTHGMDRAYLWAVPAALVAFGLSFLLKEVKLRSGEKVPAVEA